MSQPNAGNTGSGGGGGGIDQYTNKLPEGIRSKIQEGGAKLENKLHEFTSKLSGGGGEHGQQSNTGMNNPAASNNPMGGNSMNANNTGGYGGNAGGNNMGNTAGTNMGNTGSGNI